MDFEQFIDNIKQYFIDNLPNYIDAVNAVKTDLEVPYPNKYKIDLPDTLQNTETIVFYLLPWDYEITYLSNESNNFISNIKIIVTFKNDSSENLYKVAHRYLNAIYKLLVDKNTIADTVDYTVINGMNYESEIQQGIKAIEINITTNVEI